MFLDIRKTYALIPTICRVVIERSIQRGNALDVAPDFASVILGFSNTFSCLTGIISPILIGFLVQNQVIITIQWLIGNANY